MFSPDICIVCDKKCRFLIISKLVLRMRLAIFLFAALLFTAQCLETCREVVLHGVGDVDGKYLAPTDYRGRPDFFREDGVYNLFGEEEDGVCYWRIDSSMSEFPFWRSYDCSYHPVDIEAEWTINLSGLDPEIITFEVVCDEPVSETHWEIYLMISATVVMVFLLTLFGHIICRRKRIRKANTECVVCRKSASEAAKVVERGFDRRPSVL